MAKLAAPREIFSYREPQMHAVVNDECDVCAKLAVEWDRWADRDLLIEINNHPHEVPKLARVRQWKAEGVPTR
ncbi:predicted protein [Streptomyces sp. SPB78]|uniref:hypothetical protein n=1 Tax=Streptomyces sp. (strain SPB78) TaxID=591157 RepID=UPI0001DED8AA|nr:hypothetical protein [Streptomyces sp. SPB78]EFK99531.1 predicted protein [Streptomyces sp. SPB78]